MTKSEGAVGVYDDQFTAMEKKLAEVQMIIDGFNQSKADMTDISADIDEIRYAVVSFFSFVLVSTKLSCLRFT